MKYSILIIGLILILLSGIANGVHETIHYHWDAFEQKFPNANKNFWKPLGDTCCDCENRFRGSWVNKYKNYPDDLSPKFIGSTTIFVFLTDAKHLMAEIYFWFLVLGVTFLSIFAGSKFTKRFYWIISVTVVTYIVKGIGFHLFYTLIV